MEITSEELRGKITNGEKILIDFYGKFCGPCKIMKPWFEQAEKEMKETNPNVKLYLFDIDRDRDFVMFEMGLKSVPAIKGFSGGKEVYHNIGILRKDQIIQIANEL